MKLRLIRPTEFDLYRATANGYARFVDTRAMKDEIHLDTDGAKDLDAGKHKGTAVPISAGQDKGLFIFPKYYPVTKDIYENLITKK